jgi:hypothetical protein
LVNPHLPIAFYKHDAPTMKIHADAEMAIITNGVARLKSQRESTRLGVRVEAQKSVRGVIGDGRGMSILPPHFNPGVSLSEVAPAERES